MYDSWFVACPEPNVKTQDLQENKHDARHNMSSLSCLNVYVGDDDTPTDWAVCWLGLRLPRCCHHKTGYS